MHVEFFFDLVFERVLNACCTSSICWNVFSGNLHLYTIVEPLTTSKILHPHNCWLAFGMLLGCRFRAEALRQCLENFCGNACYLMRYPDSLSPGLHGVPAAWPAWSLVTLRLRDAKGYPEYPCKATQPTPCLIAPSSSPSLRERGPACRQGLCSEVVNRFKPYLPLLSAPGFT